MKLRFSEYLSGGPSVKKSLKRIRDRHKNPTFGTGPCPAGTLWFAIHLMPTRGSHDPP